MTVMKPDFKKMSGVRSTEHEKRVTTGKSTAGVRQKKKKERKCEER
jgi:hypothetical protein